MKIVARLNGENPNLADRLRREGHKAKLVKGAVVCDLRRRTDGTYAVPATMLLWGKPTMLIDVAESGGSTGGSGSSQIVCGLSGKPLRPYFVPRDQTPGGSHAFFSVPTAVVTVLGSKKGHVKIREMSIQQVNGSVQMEMRELWAGIPAALPEDCEQYRAACEAALDKANCNGCREPHFAT